MNLGKRILNRIIALNGIEYFAYSSHIFARKVSLFDLDQLPIVTKNSFCSYACIIIWEIESNILHLPCKSYANFSIIKHNTALQGSVIETLLFTTENECRSTCMMEHRCKSYNKETSGDMKCELNDKTSEDWRDWDAKAVNRTGWTFRSTNYNFSLVRYVRNCS